MSTIVVDAERPISCTVTAADQKNHVWCSPSRCVGANALRRKRGVLDARVGADIMWLTRRGRQIRYRLHPNTKAAVKAYDEAKQMIPVGFVMQFIPPTTALGARAGEKPGSDRRSGARESVATRSPSHRHLNVEPS